ncbi:MAG: 3-hydroxylacyl-ACP dehydratase [Anaeromyxobacteraceae bacterium]
MNRFPPVASLLPHSGPAVLLDEILAADEGSVTCRLVVRADSPGSTDGRVPAAIVMEYMAQAVGVFAGLRGLHRGEAPRVGYLLGTRELTVEADSLSAGDVLEVEARSDLGDEDLGSFACTAWRQGSRIAVGDLKVYLVPRESEPR